MNKKEILFICLIICCLFSLQAVVAQSDGNSTDHVVLTTDSNVSAYSLPNTDNQLLAGSDAGTFSDLQDDLSRGGDIVLTKNYTFNSTIDDGLKNGISIPDTVNSITGSGNIVIDGSQQARIFNIHSGHSIVLTGITFINANADGNGGSINSDGTLIISDCNFINNTASGHGGAIYLGSGEGDTITNCNFEGNIAGGNGGAIDWYAGSSKGEIAGSTFTDNTAKRSGGAVHWSGHYGTIRDSNFTNNTATGEVTGEIGGIVGGGDGGAVLWVGSNGTVDNCMFIDNTAQNRGGAIFLHGNSTENCTNTTLSHSIFINNTAGLNGGAVDWQEGAHDGVVTYCDFTNNTASSTGGAIYWSGHNGTVINSSFTRNKALGNGGAIVWKGAEGDIINSTFTLNNATRNGGAIFMQGGSNEDCTNITVDGGIFIDNYAGRNGGALDWYEGAHDADLYNSVFINNTAERSGGAVYWFGHDGTIINSTFENNTAKGNVSDYDSYGRLTPGGHGGAIMWTGANGKVLNSTFRLNNASRNGGAIYMQGSTDGDCSNILVDGSEFVENYAGINGGALDWYEGAHDSTLSNSYFFNNTANRSGGAVYWFGHDGTIVNSTFENNRALGNINATDSYGRVTPGGHGGAIIWTGANGKVLNSTFTLNNASRNGGAIYMQGSVDESGNIHDCSNITVDGSRFVENYAGINGGALDWYEGAHDADLYNSVFINNTAERSGGAVYWFGHDGAIKNSSFVNNAAKGNVLLNGSDDHSGHGGAIMWTGANGKVEDSTFTKNYAQKDGGSVFIEGDNCLLYDSQFDDNTAGDDGGAIFWTGQYGKIYNVTANNNRGISSKGSHSKGGTIIITGSDMTVDTLSVSNSFAEEDAGGMFLTGNNVNITNAQFINCSASMDGTAQNITRGGGAVIIGNNTRLVNVDIEDSQAERGGAIYWQGNDGYAYDVTAARNYATNEGGAFFIEGENCQIYNSEFTDNVAGDDGGAINWEGDNGHIEGCNFKNSTALSMWDIHELRYHTSKGGAVSITGDNLEILNSNFTDSSTKNNGNNENFGGTLFITGENVKIDGCEFNNSTSTLSDGGAIYIIGDHTEISNSAVSNSDARSGGAIYSTGSYCTVYNSNFTDNLAELSGGAIYWYGGASSKYNTVDGCIFTNNTAHGNTSDAAITRGGGAIYWSEGGEHGTIKNSEFYYNSVQSSINKKVDGGAVLWDRSYHALVDNCTFIGDFVTTDGDGGGTGSAAVWAQGGAMYLRPNSNYTVSNCLFENCSSSKEAGALYIQSAPGNIRVLVENSVFINNVAEARGTGNINGGGAIQIKECYNAVFNNLTFINNTANKGGGLCVYNSVNNLVVTGANFTGNKAVRGSAISASVSFTLNDAVLIENRANTSSLDLTFNRANAGSVDILLKGNDNRLNAMYIKGSRAFSVNCNNVTYWTDDNILTGKTAVTSSPQASGDIPVPEAGIAILVEIFDGDNIKLHEGVYATDANGKIHLNLADILTEPYSTDNIYVNARLLNEDYYTMVEKTSRDKNINISASALDTIFHRNTTVTANITTLSGAIQQSASGIISVYIDDVFKGNMTIEHGQGSLENILTNFTADQFFEAGNHTVFLKYWGDAFFNEVNTTVSFNITKAQSNLTVTIDDRGYDLQMNFTISDDWDGKEYGDANGTATVDFYSESDPTVVVRSVDVRIVNGSGSVVVRDLLPRNYTIITTYHNDHNYNSSSNITTYHLPEKEFVAIFLDVNAYDIMVNETVYINITIVPPEGYDVPGNVTLYLDNKGYNLTLTMEGGNATAKFNATNLTEGIKKVIVFYEGSKLLQPAKGEADFRVHKYDTPLSANVTNITVIQNEIINITLLNDTTGIVSAIVDGKEYFGRIKNGTVSIELPKLPVGEYNVTLFYEGDNKYHNATNYTVFYVRQAAPEIIIDVDNVTYGNETVIVVTLPEDATGNVTVKINDTYYVFDTQNLTDGKAILPGVVLPAGNYTVEVTYNGDENYTVNTNSTNFAVYKAKPMLNITAEDIYYGEETNITVTVPDGVTGNITIKINGTDKNITLPIVDGKVNWTVGGLAVGNHVVIATYNGNDNYTEVSVTDDFKVMQIGTVLDVDVHNIPVWDTEYVNVTIKDAAGNIITNATGNVTISIDGVDYTVEIKDGVARFNTTNLTIGHRVVWVFYDGDRNLTGNRSKAEFNVTQRVPEINVTALNITVGQEGKITINIPANATGYVVLSGNFTKNPIYVNEFTNGVAEVTVDDLAAGNYSVHIKYYGDALDNYTVAENDTTFTVSKINATVTIVANNVTYGTNTTIVVTVPEGATGNITLKLNDTTGRSITLPIVDGKATWIVEGLAAGNYTVNATYNGNDDYNINTESAKFEVRKADPGLDFVVSGTVHDNATVRIFINDEIHGKVASVTIDGVTYTNVSVDEEFFTHVLTEYKPYTVIVEYAGNENFTDARVEHTFTPSKVTTYGLNITPMNITVGDDEIITVEVPDNVDDVVIWVNGTKYRNNSFSGNKVTFNVTGLKEGIYTVTARVNDTEFEHINVTALFTVSKIYPSINITVVNDTSIYVNDTVKVIVTVPSDVTENVTIEINGMKFTNSTVNGNATFYIPQITYGNKTVVATYPGDDKYRFNSTTAQFTVNKRDSYDMIVNVTEVIDVGDVAQVNVTLPSNATGQVVVKVDGQNYTINLTDGKGSVEIRGLLNGTYPVEVIYPGDDQYASASNNTQVIKVNKVPSTVTVNVDNITVGDVAAVNITVITNATGNVTIVIGNEYNKTVGVTGGLISVVVPGLSVGNKTVTVTYNGDDRFLPSEDSANFTVGKAASGIDLVVENITYGEIETIVAYINATGNVTIKLNDYEIETVPIVNGKVVYPVERLNAGNYTVEVIYNGDSTTNPTSAKANFTVYKADPIITIEVEDIFYGDVEHIIVHVNAEGNVTVIVDNRTVEEISLENGQVILRASRWNVPDYNGNATVNVEGLAAGHYPVVAIFNGNENYNKATATVDFEVYKLNTTVSVEVEPSMKIGETQVINITVNNTNAAGVVIVNVDGVNNTVPLTNGSANFTIKALTSGNHTIVVIYEGDRNLTGNWTSATFEVTKLDAPINMTISNSTVGGKQTITVEVPKNATGQVLIDINDQHYYANVSDGKAILELDALPAGEYDVVATYLGDDIYLGNSTSGKFNVTMNNSTLEIAPQNITYGESETITFTVPEDATGNITVVVNNETYTVPVSGGTGTLTIPKLPAGNYTINATYNGDDKYGPVSNSTSFEVSKVNDTDIKVIDQGNGTVVVVVGDNATGNITIKVGDNNFTAEIVNGTAVIDLVNETPGVHDIEVIYSGDDNHNPVTTNGTATIPKLATPISVTVENIKVGDKEHIVVTVPDNATGNVTIEIDGIEYTAEISNGKATFEIENLTYGNKTVCVEYIGDNNYTGNHTSANFTVDKRQSYVNVTVDPIDVGEDAVITVTVPQNATGYVIVEIDNQTYAIKVKDGTGSATIKGLASGDYPINVTYLGDDQYFNSTNATSLKVSKVPSSINVTVENITVGENAVINIEVPEDVCGNVTVSVDGKNYTVPVSGGKGTLVVPDLEVGNHTVDVKFEGCKKYEPSQNSTNFTVSKVDTNPTDIKVIDQGNGTVVVVVPDNAAGTVEIKVGDNVYNATVEDGIATIDLVNETPGTYDLNVTYSGDKNHTAANTTGTATIPKLATPMNVTVENIKVGDKEHIVVTVPDDATGNVTIEINGVKYTAEIKDGKATFEIENLTYGNKTVYVDYIGDNNYTGNHTSAKFTVDKRNSTVKAETTQINVGETAVIEITVPDNATGYVIVEIADKTYAVEVENGKGTLEVDGLASGTHDIKVKYLGDNQYLPSNTTSTIVVSKVPSTINVTAENITVGDKAVINVEVPEDVCGNVTVRVGGQNYTVPVSGGKGILVISGLAAGNYTVDAIFDGCKKYEPSNATTKFTVSKAKTDDMQVIDQGNGTIAVVVGDNATGNVTVKVGNETYTAEVVNGTAVIPLVNNTPGKYDVEVIYSGDGTHEPQVADSTVTIPKYNTPISVDVDDCYVGDTAVVTVTLPDDATGEVTIEINGKSYTTKVKDGKAVFNVKGLKAGDKTVAVSYGGDSNYVGNSTTDQFTVSKRPSTVSATGKNINVGKDEVITVTVPKDATGRVLVDINGVGYYATIVNGKAKVIIPELPAGKYTAKVTYEGDDKYRPSTTTAKFTVTKVKTPISATGDDIDQGQDATVVVNVPSDATGTVTINVDGKIYTVEVKNGQAVFYVPGLSKGDYKVTASYSGDKKYESNDTVTDIEVYFNENPNPNHNHNNNGGIEGAIGLSKHATGNPILVLIVVLLAIGSIQIRRFRK